MEAPKARSNTGLIVAVVVAVVLAVPCLMFAIICGVSGFISYKAQREQQEQQREAVPPPPVPRPGADRAP
jgi:hypothetical protein